MVNVISPGRIVRNYVTKVFVLVDLLDFTTIFWVDMTDRETFEIQTLQGNIWTHWKIGSSDWTTLPD